jgi:flap endonuclease-1
LLPQDESKSAQSNLPYLEERSSLMYQSFHRRMNLPTEETYKDSRRILRAMGVPCVVCTGEFEAEALAAALVLKGYADYVASEDTVRTLNYVNSVNTYCFLFLCLPTGRPSV